MFWSKEELLELIEAFLPGATQRELFDLWISCLKFQGTAYAKMRVFAKKCHRDQGELFGKKKERPASGPG